MRQALGQGLYVDSDVSMIEKLYVPSVPSSFSPREDPTRSGLTNPRGEEDGFSGVATRWRCDTILTSVPRLGVASKVGQLGGAGQMVGSLLVTTMAKMGPRH